MDYSSLNLKIGLLNSFTNYAHHTYHIPQSMLVKWIAFSVSMLEIIILCRVIFDVTASIRKRVTSKTKTVHQFFINLSRSWTCVLLFQAILISIPPLNTLIHGTHVVTAHAMGSEIGIDTYILLGAIAFILHSWFSEDAKSQVLLNGRSIFVLIRMTNIAFLCLFSWLVLSGLLKGVSSYLGEEAPALTKYTPFVFASMGSLMAIFFLLFLRNWVKVVWESYPSFFPAKKSVLIEPVTD